MVKKISILIISLLFFQLTPAFAAVKAGAVCKPAGLTSIVSGKTFTCIKSGKKLVWDKGVKIVTPNPLPISSFSDLSVRLKDIKYLAWAATQKAIDSSPTQDSAIEIKVGPATTKYSKKIQKL